MKKALLYLLLISGLVLSPWVFADCDTLADVNNTNCASVTINWNVTIETDVEITQQTTIKWNLTIENWWTLTVNNILSAIQKIIDEIV